MAWRDMGSKRWGASAPTQHLKTVHETVCSHSATGSSHQTRLEHPITMTRARANQSQKMFALIKKKQEKVIEKLHVDHAAMRAAVAALQLCEGRTSLARQKTQSRNRLLKETDSCLVFLSF